MKLVDAVIGEVRLAIRGALIGAMVAAMLLIATIIFAVLMLMTGTMSARADGCFTMRNGNRYCSIGYCQTNTWRGGWWASRGCRRRR